MAHQHRAPAMPKPIPRAWGGNLAALLHCVTQAVNWVTANTPEAAPASDEIRRPVALRQTSILATAPLIPPVRWLRLYTTSEWLVGLLAAVLSVAFYVWYASQGWVFGYGDAISHLMIARRVVAGPTPGLAQLGSVWLPLNHLLMLPLVWIDPLYRSGFAGAFPSMVAYILSAIYLYRTGRLLFASSVAGWVVTLIFILNPNILYLQATPMAELDMLCAAIIAVYYLFKWALAYNTLDLVKAAAAIAASTLIRYDAWPLALAGACVVAFVAWYRSGLSDAADLVVLYGLMAFAGCAAWLLYNGVIFHNPLYWFNGPYSAKYQQQSIEAAYGLPTHHHLWLSTHIYTQSVIDTVGWPIALLALLGFVSFLLRFRLAPHSAPVFLTLVPFVFNVTALWLGISTMGTPEITVNGARLGYINVRYGLMMVPAVALFVGAVVAVTPWQRLPELHRIVGMERTNIPSQIAVVWGQFRRALPQVALAVVCGLALFWSGLNPLLGAPYTLEDPIHNANARLLDRQEAQWLATHYHGGSVLIGGAVFEALMFESGLPDRVFVTENARSTFHHAVQYPQLSVTWIVMEQNASAIYDPVSQSLRSQQNWRRYFVLRQVIWTTAGNAVEFYELNGSG